MSDTPHQDIKGDFDINKNFCCNRPIVRGIAIIQIWELIAMIKIPFTNQHVIASVQQKIEKGQHQAAIYELEA